MSAGTSGELVVVVGSLGPRLTTWAQRRTALEPVVREAGMQPILDVEPVDLAAGVRMHHETGCMHFAFVGYGVWDRICTLGSVAESRSNRGVIHDHHVRWAWAQRFDHVVIFDLPPGGSVVARVDWFRRALETFRAGCCSPDR